MATLASILTAQAGVPAQVESRFPMIPKISNILKQAATMIPAGPDLPVPAVATTVPTIPEIPNIFQGPTQVGAQKIILEPGKPPTGLQTKYVTSPSPAGNLTNTVIERRGM